MAVVGKFVDNRDKLKDVCLYEDDTTHLFYAVNINGSFYNYTKPFESYDALEGALRRYEITWMSLYMHIKAEEKLLKEIEERKTKE